jgi:hypothetical protein
MAAKRQRRRLVGIKVEAELADLLNQLPNKSAFIRRAILAKFDALCPLCSGTGVVSKGLYGHFAPLLAAHHCRPCDGCGSPQPLPADLAHFGPGDHPRLGQMLRGGPLLCATCYLRHPACDACGLHRPVELIVEHRRQAHSS